MKDLSLDERVFMDGGGLDILGCLQCRGSDEVRHW